MIAHKSTTVFGTPRKDSLFPGNSCNTSFYSVCVENTPTMPISAEERAVVDEVSPCSVNTHLALPCPPAWS